MVRELPGTSRAFSNTNEKCPWDGLPTVLASRGGSFTYPLKVDSAFAHSDRGSSVAMVRVDVE